MAYTVAMAEVAVGSGAQLGRLAGGLLFDLGGFGCPFLVASVPLDSFNDESNAQSLGVQMRSAPQKLRALSLCALVGLMFEDEVQEDEEVCRGLLLS